MERVLLIIKPNVIKKKKVGEVINRLEQEGYNIIAAKMVRLSKDEAENFYYIHRGKPFYNPLVDFMISENCIPLVLEGKDVIMKVREFIGPTDPRDSKPGSIRADFGDSLRENAVHASDSLESARFEVNYFFPELAF